MASKVKCPCGATLMMPELAPGGSFSCSQCGRRLTLKNPAAPAAPTPAAPTPAANPSAAVKPAPAVKPVPAVKPAAPVNAAPVKVASAPRPAAAAGKSSRLPLVLAVVLLVAVGGGGLAFWLTRSQTKTGPVAQNDKDKQTDGDRADGPKGKGKGKTDAGVNGVGGKTVEAPVTPLAIDTTYVTRDFCAAAVVAPAAALQAPLLGSLLPPAWRTLAAQAVGTELSNVEQLMVLVEPPPAVAPERPVLADLATFQPKPAAALKGHTFDLRAITFSADGRWVLTAGGDKRVRIYDPRTGVLIRGLPGLDDFIRGIALSPNKKGLAIASWDKTVRLWSFDTNSARILPTGVKEDFDAVAISPDGQTLAAAGRSKDVYVFDLPAGTLRHTLTGHKEPVTHLAFPRDNKTLFSYGNDNELRLWDHAAGKSLGSPIKNAFGDAMAVSPDGSLVALGSFDNEVRLHELPSGKLIKQLKTNAGVRGLAFRFDGKVLASGGGGFEKKGEVKLWQVPDGKLLHDLPQHAKDVYAVAFSPDGTRLVSGGQDPLAHVWSLSPSAEVEEDVLPLPVALVVRLKNAKDAKGVLAHAIGPAQDRNVGGKAIAVSMDTKMAGEPLAGHIAAGGILVVARLSTLTKMLAAQKESSPLIERLGKMPAGEAQAVIWVEPLRKLLTDAAKEMKSDLPPPVAGALPLLEQAQFAALALNLRGDNLATLSLDMADAVGAEQCQQVLQQAVALGKALYPQLRESLGAGLPADLSYPLLASADQAYAGMAVTKEATRVTLSLKRPDIPALPADLIAASGFNAAKGMYASAVPGAPFPLDASDRPGGIGEPGWAGPWTKYQAATYQTKVVFEGDGALFLTGAANVGPNLGRQFVPPQTGKFQVEYHVQVPAGSSVAGYLWKSAPGGAYHSGPYWRVEGGKFRPNDGDESGGGALHDAFPCEPGKWHKVTLRVDVARRKWDFLVDDQQFLPPRPLGFRTKQDTLDVINFLVEGGVYIDALRVTRYTGEVGKSADSKQVAKVDPKKDVAKPMLPTKEPPPANDPPKKPEPMKPEPKAPVRPADWPDTRLASAGFNDAQGMNAGPMPEAPYPLNKNNVPGGAGEFGWDGPWNAHEKIGYQSKVVFEGDGAVHVLPRGKSYGLNLHRRLASALIEPFEVTQHVKVPAKGGIRGYITSGEANNNAGPVWTAEGGVFSVLDGNEKGSGKTVKVGKVDGDRWHKVTVFVDPPKRKWDLAIDDKKVREGIGFRFPIQSLRTVDYLSEWTDGFYLDAVVVERRK